MSNFDAFSKDSLARLIEPFAKGMADHITPIKYEALTPDIFAFLFRTTGKSSSGLYKEHYFVSLEFDYLENLQEAKGLIEDWHQAKVIEFWNPDNKHESDNAIIQVNDTYKALLAKVERPKGHGYWANNHVILSPDMIEDFVLTLDENRQDGVRKALHQIFNDYPGVSVSVYTHPDGRAEFFYK